MVRPLCRPYAEREVRPMRLIRSQPAGMPAGLVALAVCLLGGASSPVRADLIFGQTTVNVGVVWTGKPLTHRFAFVNTGPESVQITDLQASCGCLTPRVVGREYSPGQTGELLLEINTLTHKPGPHTWTLQVHYRAGGESRRAHLRLTATVRAEITVQPAALTMYTAGRASHALTLTDLRIKPLEVTRVVSSCAQLTGHVTNKSQNAHGHAVRMISVEVGDDFPEGRH